MAKPVGATYTSSKHLACLNRPVASNTMTDQRVFLGRYQSLRLLGHGGTSRVYLARPLDAQGQEAAGREWDAAPTG